MAGLLGCLFYYTMQSERRISKVYIVDFTGLEMLCYAFERTCCKDVSGKGQKETKRVGTRTRHETEKWRSVRAHAIMATTRQSSTTDD